MDGVSAVCGELTQCSLAATHTLCKAATSACHTQSKRPVVSMANHQRVGAGDVPWGGRDVS